MIAKANPQIQRAVGVLMELSADEQTRLKYEYREKARRDKLSQMLEARDEGKLEGKIEGKIEIARNLLALNFSLDDIAKATELPREEIERLH
jgi:predicted transposase/invertase (TIGR01784 family)